MSKFYGQVGEGGGARSFATRCGHQNIRAAAQTWEGSLIAIARKSRDGEIYFEIEINADDSSNYGKTIFSGSLDELAQKLSK